jgi:hypothetical protein
MTDEPQLHTVTQDDVNTRLVGKDVVYVPGDQIAWAEAERLGLVDDGASAAPSEDGVAVDPATGNAPLAFSDPAIAATEATPGS